MSRRLLALAACVFLALGAYRLGLFWLTPASAFVASAGAAATLGLALIALRLHGEQRRLAAEIETLRGALRGIEHALAHGRGEAEALREATRNGEAGDRRMTRVVAEVRVLQSLIERMSAVGALTPATENAPDPPAAPDAKAETIGLARPATVVETVHEALRLDRVDVYLQPVVSLPQRKTRFYECYSRIRASDGTVLMPEDYLGPAEHEGLVGTIDNILLFRGIQLVRRTRRRNFDTAFFCNLSPRSLSDSEFFASFVEFLKENAELSGGLIFEFRQDEATRVFAERRAELARLARMGFRFSLDHVANFDLNLDELVARDVRFVKIDADRLLPGPDGKPPVDLKGLKAQLDRQAIDLVVAKIEQEKDLIELLDAGIDFGQGYLFGEPRLSRAA